MKPFTRSAAVIFALIALAHAYRIATHFQVVLGSHPVPQGASWVGMVIGAVLSVMLFREAKR